MPGSSVLAHWVNQSGHRRPSQAIARGIQYLLVWNFVKKSYLITAQRITACPRERSVAARQDTRFEFDIDISPTDG